MRSKKEFRDGAAQPASIRRVTHSMLAGLYRQNRLETSNCQNRTIKNSQPNSLILSQLESCGFEPVTTSTEAEGERRSSIHGSFGTQTFQEVRANPLTKMTTENRSTSAARLIDWDQSCQAFDSATYRSLKRVLDVAGALIGLVVFGPLMLIAMLLVWLEDGGPTIFRQQRVGLSGDRFTFFKIRTMVKDAEARLAEVAALNHHEDARTFKLKDDPRMLKVGRFLRRYSIDELPQLFNVLSGEMSIVGPRPPLPREVDLYDPEDYVRLTVRPGLTCYWQISGRGAIPFKEQVILDRRYICDSSLTTDIKIILKTFPSIIRGSGAH